MLGEGWGVGASEIVCEPLQMLLPLRVLESTGKRDAYLSIKQASTSYIKVFTNLPLMGKILKKFASGVRYILVLFRGIYLGNARVVS